MKFKVDRIISIATLAASLVAIILVLKKPAPVAQPQAQVSVQSSKPAAQSEPQTQWAPPAPTQNFQAQNSQTQEPQTQPSQAQLAPSGSASTPSKTAASDGLSAMLSGLNPESNAGNGEPNIKDQQISYEGDIVHGRFLTEVGGKDVWVTISGKMGEKDGYATFDPTEFKVGDMNVPVALVNPALQKKLSEERDRLKIPDGGSN